MVDKSGCLFEHEGAVIDKKEFKGIRKFVAESVWKVVSRLW